MVAGERGRVQDRFGAVDEPGGRQVDQPVAVAGQQHGRGRRDRTEDADGVLDREHRDLRRVGQVGRGGQLELVLQRERRVGHVLGGATEGRHRPHAGRLPEQGPRLSGPGEVVALVLEVVPERDVAHAHEAGHRRDGDGIERVLLEPAVEGVEQVGRGRRAVGDELAGDVGPVDQPGRDRVDGVAPPVRREVGARHLEHPRGPAVGRLAPAVEVRGGVEPVLRAGPRAAGGSRPPCPRSTAAAGTGRPGRSRRRPGPVRAPSPGPSGGGDRRDAHPEQHGEAEGEQGHGPGEAAHRQAGVGQRGTP